MSYPFVSFITHRGLGFVKQRQLKGFHHVNIFHLSVATFCFWSVTQLCLTLPPHGLQHTRLPCPSPSPGACSNSCPLSWWCHPTNSSSVVPFSHCPLSFLASESFPMSQLFASGGQSIGASASASVLPMNIQDWFPLGLIGLILQSKELSSVFSNTTVQKHQFFHAQPSLWSNSHMTLWSNYTWLLEGDKLLTEELWIIELQVWEQTLALLDSFFWQWGAVGPWFHHHLVQSVFLHTLHGFEKLCHFWTCGSCGVDLRSRSWSFNFRKQWGIKECLNPL